jgi:hypothetical protein
VEPWSHASGGTSPLSRAIARLERQLGVTLLERTSRKVTLTEAGTALLAEGQAILAARCGEDWPMTSAAWRGLCPVLTRPGSR